MKRTEIKSLWRHPNFIKLWAGQTVSLFGSQISLLAIPLTAVLILNATPLQMGILTATAAAPYLLGILRIELLYLLAFLVGMLSIFFDVAYRSYLPSLIERQYLVEGNSKLELSRSAGEIAGPGLAGALVQVFTAPIAILVDALSFLVSALSLVWIHTPEEMPKVKVQRKGLMREIFEGLRFVFGEPMLRALTISFATLTLFNSLLEAVFVLYVVKEIGIKPAILGLIFAVGSTGFVVGALLASKFTSWIGIGITLLFAPLVIGASDLLIPLAGLVPLFAFPLLGLAQLLFGLARPVFSINQISLRQTITPERLLGRMNASVTFVVFGIPTVGALLGGAFGQSIGLQKTLVIAAIGELLACLWIFFSPIRRLRELNTLTEK